MLLNIFFKIIIILIYSSQLWIITIMQNPTDTLLMLRLSSNLDVSFISPSCTPWVPDEQVLLSIGHSVANGGNDVGSSNSTRAGIDNPWMVSLEDTGACGYMCTTWSVSYCCHEMFGRIIVNMNVVSDVYCGFVLAGFARSFDCLVPVIRLKNLTVLLHISIAITKASAMATMTLLRAVDNLLLRQRNKITRFNCMSSFDRSGDSKGPAWATVTLVLDRIDSVMVSPVNRWRDTCGVKVGWLSVVSWWDGPLQLEVFFISPGGHEIASDGESVLWIWVDDFVFGILGQEYGLSEMEFFVGSKVETVFCDVF